MGSARSLRRTRRGDTLKVHIDKITLNRNWGWGGAMPYFGALAPEYKTMMITPPVQDTLYIPAGSPILQHWGRW